MALSYSFAVMVFVCTVAWTLASPYFEGGDDDEIEDLRQIRFGQHSYERFTNGTCVCLSESSDVREQASSRSSVILSASPNDCFRFNGDILLKEDIWFQVRMRKGSKTGWVPYKYLEVAHESACSLKSDTNDEMLLELGLARGGPVSSACLGCICKMESGCNPIGCRMDVGSLSCGYFQIKYAYWLDCGKPGGDWKTCANNFACASGCVQAYMSRYAAHYKCPMTCEGFAREHNGGPRGCHNPNTLAYWERLQKIPGCRGVRH